MVQAYTGRTGNVKLFFFKQAYPPGCGYTFSVSTKLDMCWNPWQGLSETLLTPGVNYPEGLLGCTIAQDLWLELSRCAAMCYRRGGRRRNAALLRLEVHHSHALFAWGSNDKIFFVLGSH